MKTPISGLIRDRINDLDNRLSIAVNKNDEQSAHEIRHRIGELLELSIQIKAIEKESVENLLEQMPNNFSLYEAKWLYRVYTKLDSFWVIWITPQEAIKSLKEKLTNQ